MKKEENIDILTRGVSSIYPSKEYVLSLMNSNKKLKIYLGIDPTGPTLHLGHAIVLKKLRDFQKAGHKIILLMGDFTAMIGDPTDKSAARKQLTHKEVMSNLKNYKKQASKLISFTGKNPASFKFNSKWLSKMNFGDVLSLASQMTVGQMLERDMFQKRIQEEKPIFIHEFMYPLMQGYDSVAMDVDGEIGGNDQTFNMLCGRDLMKSLKNKEKFVITTKLLEDNTGKKMGKTEGNMITISDNPDQMFGKIMSWTDGLIAPGFELCTDLPISYIKEVEEQISSNKINPKDLKMKLAYEIISIYHGEKKAEEAKYSWEKTFSKKEIPENVEIVKVKKEDLLIDVFVNENIIPSKSEAKRLVDDGAITYMDNDQKVLSYQEKIKEGVYKIGKKRFCRIVVNK